MSRKKVSERYQTEIDQLYINVTMMQTLGKRVQIEDKNSKKFPNEEELDPSWFDRLGGNSIGFSFLLFTFAEMIFSETLYLSPLIAAMEIVNELRDQNIDVAFEDIVAMKNGTAPFLSRNQRRNRKESGISTQAELEALKSIMSSSCTSQEKISHGEQQNGIFLTGSTGFLGLQLLYVPFHFQFNFQVLSKMNNFFRCS